MVVFIIIFTAILIRLPLIYSEKKAAAVCRAAQPGTSIQELIDTLKSLGHQDNIKYANQDILLVSFSSLFIEKFTCVIRISSGKVIAAEVNYTD